MHLTNQNWHSAASTLNRIHIPSRNPRQGVTRMPKNLSEAQQRALPILTAYLLAHPGSTIKEVCAGVCWDNSQTKGFLDRCAFPSVGVWKNRRFYAHGQRPVDA